MTEIHISQPIDGSAFPRQSAHIENRAHTRYISALCMGRNALSFDDPMV